MGVELAPNMKKLASEGMYFSNFYSQESVGQVVIQNLLIVRHFFQLVAGQCL